MQTVSVSTGIPAGEFERFVEEMNTGTLGEVLERIAEQFVPDKTALARQVRELAQAAPLGALFSHTKVDWEGRPEAEIGPLDGDFDGHLAYSAHRERPDRFIVNTPIGAR
jgi:hypothetical protein